MIVFDQGGMPAIWTPYLSNPVYLEFLRKGNGLDLISLMHLDRVQLFHRMNELLWAITRSLNRFLPEGTKNLNGIDALLIVGSLLNESAPYFEDDAGKEEFSVLLNGIHEAITTIRMFRLHQACEIQFGIALPDLVSSAEKGHEQSLLFLARLEPAVLSTPFAKTSIEYNSISNNHEFFRKLSEAVRPDANFWRMKAHRNRYALTLLSGLGYQTRPYRDWAEFFLQYNLKYAADITTKAKTGFSSYEDESTLAKACKRYLIPKKHAKSRI